MLDFCRLLLHGGKPGPRELPVNLNSPTAKWASTDKPTWQAEGRHDRMRESSMLTFDFTPMLAGSPPVGS